MNTAIAQAQKSLDNFLKLKSAPLSGTSQFTVKVLFTQGEAKEHMWVMPFRAAPGAGFEGILQNDARFISTLRRGQQVRFSREQVTDWGYSKDGTLLGFFTVCAMFARAPEQRAQLEASGQRYACAP